MYRRIRELREDADLTQMEMARVLNCSQQVYSNYELGQRDIPTAVLIALAAYYLIFPRLSVEFEYTLLNHDMQIDAIYNRAKRKSRMNFDIQNAEIIAPKKSPRLNSYHAEKVHDFSSGSGSAKVYAIMIPIDKKNACIYIEPDEKMLDHMQQWMGSKMFRD